MNPWEAFENWTGYTVYKTDMEMRASQYGLVNPQLNAFAHAYVSARLAAGGNDVSAFALGHGREAMSFFASDVPNLFATGNMSVFIASQLDSNKDLYNNLVGTGIGTASKRFGLSEDFIAEAVLRALERGDLVVDPSTDDRVSAFGYEIVDIAWLTGQFGGGGGKGGVRGDAGRDDLGEAWAHTYPGTKFKAGEYTYIVNEDGSVTNLDTGRQTSPATEGTSVGATALMAQLQQSDTPLRPWQIEGSGPAVMLASGAVAKAGTLFGLANKQSYAVNPDGSVTNLLSG